MNTENNKIIAEFMGLYYCEKYQFEGWYKNHECNERVCELNYDFDWNWLMEVVEKIENTVFGEQQYKFKFLVQNNHCSIEQSNLFNTKRTYAKTKIEATYNACVEFIKWYNEQKK